MSQQQEFLTFRLGSEYYAVDILRVQEIRGWQAPSPLPNVPFFVKGAIDLRGLVVPIVDLRERFALNADYRSTTVVIVVHVLTPEGERVIGLVVDEVSDVQCFDLDALQAAPDISEGVHSSFILGLATTQQNAQAKMVIILALDRLINEGVMQAL
ncbi:MAG: purine-binding chemotaxis protein CheW [Thiotrichales bacterium]|nr:purine-binding chemotaxis protein CheW [Thiotrichales bacterium]